MTKICFICHGNICRSPMAEYVLKHKLKLNNLENKIIVVSRATSYEEQGNDMHSGTKRMLEQNNIEYTHHKATRLEKEDYNRFDHFICMDDNNMKNTLLIFGEDKEHKIFKLLKDKNVKDPWYTGNFEETYEDIDIGTDRIIGMLKIELNNK